MKQAKYVLCLILGVVICVTYKAVVPIPVNKTATLAQEPQEPQEPQESNTTLIPPPYSSVRIKKDKLTPYSRPRCRGRIHAVDLSQKYEENEIGANSMYGGGLYDVYGNVKSIGIGILGGYYVVFEGNGWLSGVHCSFKTSSHRLENLKKGDRCTIRGTIGRGGTTLGSVMLKDCELQFE